MPARTPTVTIDFSPTFDSSYCYLNIHLRDFAANTTYTVDVCDEVGSCFDPYQVTTDANGDADLTPFSLSMNSYVLWRAAVGDVSSEFVPQACSA